MPISSAAVPCQTINLLASVRRYTAAVSGAWQGAPGGRAGNRTAVVQHSGVRGEVAQRGTAFDHQTDRLLAHGNRGGTARRVCCGSDSLLRLRSLPYPPATICSLCRSHFSVRPLRDSGTGNPARNAPPPARDRSDAHAGDGFRDRCRPRRTGRWPLGTVHRHHQVVGHVIGAFASASCESVCTGSWQWPQIAVSRVVWPLRLRVLAAQA